MDRKSRQDAARRAIIEHLDAAIAQLSVHPELAVLGSRLAAIREIAALEQAAGRLAAGKLAAGGLAEEVQAPYRPVKSDAAGTAQDEAPEDETGKAAHDKPG